MSAQGRLVQWGCTAGGIILDNFTEVLLSPVTAPNTVDLPWLHFDDEGNGQFRCKLCGRGYRWRESLLRHLRVECGKEAQFQCPLCPIRTKHKHSLLRHVRKHVGSSFPSCQ